jgi:hypothetical protein
MAARTLDRRAAAAGDVRAGELQQLPVAGRGGRHGCLGDHGTGGRGYDGGGVGVLVGVDADDELGGVCQHVHRVGSLPGDDVVGAGPDEARQDCDGTRSTGIGRSGS